MVMTPKPSCGISEFLLFPNNSTETWIASSGRYLSRALFPGGRHRRRHAVSLCDGDHALSRIGQPHKHMAISMVPAADPLI
jgi:hypothetical protein